MVRDTFELKVLFLKVLKKIIIEVDDVLQAMPKLFEVNELTWGKNTYSVPDRDQAMLNFFSMEKKLGLTCF